MKTKLFKTLAATAMSVLAIACAKEPVADNGQQAGVSFMVEVPGASVTKAYGEAEKATKLYYQVFDNAGAPIEGLGVQTADLVGKAAKVSFQLVKDQTYNFVFWAQTTETGYYTIDETEGLKKITADYTNKLANDENFDAFYAVKKIKISGPVSESVELTRPFAQINIATKGVLKAGETEMKIDFTGATSSVTIEEVPTEFFPLSPAASQFGSETVTARFKTADAPSGNMTIDNNTYKYLALNYVFAPTDGTVYDITAKLRVDGKTVNLNVPAAPAKRNWRTNILGNLLTSSADINVIVTPGFDENGNEDIDLSNIKTETELKAVLATYGAATISNEVALTSSLSTTGDKTLTIESNGLIAPASDMRKDISEIIYVSGGTLTLDGDGKIIGQSNGTYSYGSEAITVAGGTLNIKGNLKVAAGSGSVKSDRAVYVRKGTLNIYGGYFSTSDDASGNPNPVIFLKPDWREQAYCNIYGGIFESTGNSEYVVNIEDTERSRAHIKIYGGKFKGFDPGNVNEGTITSFLAEGYKSTKVGDYYVVTKEDVTPVANNAGLNTAIENAVSGETIVLTEPLTLTSAAIVSDKAITIDLADNTMELKQSIWTATNGEATDDAGTITFKNGTIKCLGTNSLYPSGKSKMELDNVVLTSAEDSPILVSETATLVVKNSKINAKYYGITTNATNPNQNVTIVVDNCEITGGDPILVNIPCNLTVTKSTMIGSYHGTVVRGGTATISDSKIYLDYVDDDAVKISSNYNWMGPTWKSGNSITIAALVLGNHSSAYQYPTNVTLKNTTVATKGKNAHLFPSVYAYANQGEGLGVTFNYDDKCNLSSGKGEVYNSSNIVVNGTIITK